MKKKIYLSSPGPAMPCLIPAHVPPEEAYFQPIGDDEGPAAEGEGRTEVDATPEEERRHASTRQIPIKERQIRDGLQSHSQ